MITKTTTLAACAVIAYSILGLQETQARAPQVIISAKIIFTGTEATYRDDLGRWRLNFSRALFMNDTLSYEKISRTIGVINFTDWNKVANETYTGSIELNFNSNTTGTFHEEFSGGPDSTTSDSKTYKNDLYKGFVSGTFQITELDVPGRPIARNQQLRVKPGSRTRLRLRFAGRDIRKGGPKFQLIKKPNRGRLIHIGGDRFTYIAPKKFSGAVRFRYRVTEGKAKSRVATVTIRKRN